MTTTNVSDGLSVRADYEQSPQNAIVTPAWLVERLHDVAGGWIELDPCTNPDNPVGAMRFYTAIDDGILQPWDALSIYCNPPYGKTIRHWVDKCLFAAARLSKVLLLVPARPGSRWFSTAWRSADEALFFDGRIQFLNMPSSAKFPSVLFGYNLSLEGLRDLGIRATIL